MAKKLKQQKQPFQALVRLTNSILIPRKKELEAKILFSTPFFVYF